MSDFRMKHEVVALGHIEMRLDRDSGLDELLARHRALIENIWCEIQEERGGTLFNGILPCFVRICREDEKTTVFGQFIEYKQFIAQRRRPDLQLDIKPVGVSGITVLKWQDSEYVLFARRTDRTTEYPGFLELVPSGSIDQEFVAADGVVDYRAKLLSEFIEETGLSRDCVQSVSGFALVLDTDHHVYDICCEIVLAISKETFRHAFRSDEYSDPLFVSRMDLEAFIRANVDSIVPTSAAIIEAYLKRNEGKEEFLPRRPR